MKMAVLLNQDDIVEIIKNHFEKENMEIDLTDEEIIAKVCDICRKNEAILADAHVFPVI